MNSEKPMLDLLHKIILDPRTKYTKKYDDNLIDKNFILIALETLDERIAQCIEEKAHEDVIDAYSECADLLRSIMEM